MAASYTVEIVRDWTAAVDDIAANAIAPTAFQSREWLSAWYATMGRRRGVRPLIAVCREAPGGTPAAIFPLIAMSEDTHRVAEFADLGVTDYNAPLLFGRAPTSPDQSKALARSLARSLEGEADILRLTKMPHLLVGRSNPLAHLPRARGCALGSNVVAIEGTWQSYHRSLDGKVRREVERCWRLFERSGANARLVVATQRREALHILDSLAEMQRQRITALGKPYVLDGENCGNFYSHLVGNGIEAGTTIVTALQTSDDEVVSGLLGIANGRTLYMLRLGQAGGAWARCSPGRLLFDRTMQEFHARGLREFDFTIGDYPYKETFRVVRTALVDVELPITLKGHMVLGLEKVGAAMKKRLRAVPAIYQPMRNIAGRLRRKRQAAGC